jgi:hypothetical protein
MSFVVEECPSWGTHVCLTLMRLKGGGGTFPGIKCPAIIIPSLGVSLTKLEGAAGCNRVPDRLEFSNGGIMNLHESRRQGMGDLLLIVQ